MMHPLRHGVPMAACTTAGIIAATGLVRSYPYE